MDKLENDYNKSQKCAKKCPNEGLVEKDETTPREAHLTREMSHEIPNLRYTKKYKSSGLNPS